MRCALNNRDLYKTRGRYLCIDCVLEKYNMADMCKKVSWCNLGYILKRSYYRSDIFNL